MADSKLTALTGLSTIATGDKLYVVDVSDTTDGASGTAKHITQANLLGSTLSTLSTTLTSSAAELNILDGVTATTAELNALDGITSTVTELNYTDGVTSAIQTQLNTKQATIALTASRAVVSNGSGVLAAATTTSTEIGYVNGVTSAIQTQINTKAASASPSFTGDVGLATAANIQVNGVDPWRTITLTPGFLKPATTSGCAAVTQVEAGTNDIDYDVLDFDASSDEIAYANFQMPDSWDAGVVQFRYIWTNAAGLTTETVQFELSGRSFADSDAIDQAVGTAVAVDDTWLAQGDVHISAWSGDVTLTGATAGEWVHVEIMRDVSDDNLTGDARLMGVQIRYKQGQYTD